VRQKRVEKRAEKKAVGRAGFDVYQSQKSPQPYGAFRRRLWDKGIPEYLLSKIMGIDVSAACRSDLVQGKGQP
jgi:hypothetical protein